MKINLESIPGYSEMSAEDKIKALESFEYDDNSAEVERLKNAVSKANGEAADWKKKHNALLSEDEQKKQSEADEKAQLLAKLEQLEKENTISKYTAKYIALGYDKELAADTAEAMQSGDMEKVFTNGEKHRSAMEQRIKAELMNSTPKPGGSGKDGKVEETAEYKQAKALGEQRAKNMKAAEDVLSKYTI